MSLILDDIIQLEINLIRNLIILSFDLHYYLPYSENAHASVIIYVEFLFTLFFLSTSLTDLQNQRKFKWSE